MYISIVWGGDHAKCIILCCIFSALSWVQAVYISVLDVLSLRNETSLPGTTQLWYGQYYSSLISHNVKLQSFKTPAKIWDGGDIGISLSVSLHICRKCNSPQTDCLILMKLYTVVVYDLRMCIEKDSPGLKNIKGGNRGKLYVEDGSNLCDLTYSFSSIWL